MLSFTAVTDKGIGHKHDTYDKLLPKAKGVLIACWSYRPVLSRCAGSLTS